MTQDPLTVAHVWDYKVASPRDLHTELLRRPDVRSRQYVNRLSTTSALPPATVLLHRVPSTAPRPSLIRRAARRATAFLERQRYRRFLARQWRREHPALVHAHFGPTGWQVSALTEGVGARLVVSFYGVDVSEIVHQPRWQRRYRTLFARASRLVVLCEEARQRLERLGCPPAKIRVWNHPLDLERYAYKARTPTTRVRLITAARFVEKKGYPYLLQACAGLARTGRDFTLTAVGYGDGANIERLAGSLGLGDRFRLINTSALPDFDGFYSQILHEHDIFVLPSTTSRTGDDEGGPALSLVLAQAAGLPVVCTPFTGANRTVIDGATGLFCGQDDAESLAERIAFLADRPDLWNSLGATGSALVRKDFDFARQVDAMIGIYREAVAERN